MPYWLTFIAKPTGHLDTFLVPINECQMALGVATLLIDDASTYQFKGILWRGLMDKTLKIESVGLKRILVQSLMVTFSVLFHLFPGKLQCLPHCKTLLFSFASIFWLPFDVICRFCQSKVVLPFKCSLPKPSSWGDDSY